MQVTKNKNKNNIPTEVLINLSRFGHVHLRFLLPLQYSGGAYTLCENMSNIFAEKGPTASPDSLPLN